MANIPVKTKDRLVSGIKKFQPVVKKAHDMDINESDTVTIITDILTEVFGYDKYSEITSELAIKKTYCDLAVKIGGNIRLLIEVKAAGIDLKEQHIKQAVDYGSNSGIEWVVLTNCVTWKVFKIIFSKPVVSELAYEFDLTTINPKKANDIELVYYLSKEALSATNKTVLDNFFAQKQVLNRFTVAQLILNDVIIDSIRRNLKKISTDAKTTNEEIRQILLDEIIKRDVLDGEKATEAKRKVSRALNAAAKSKTTSTKTDK